MAAASLTTTGRPKEPFRYDYLGHMVSSGPTRHRHLPKYRDGAARLVVLQGHLPPQALRLQEQSAPSIHWIEASSSSGIYACGGVCRKDFIIPDGRHSCSSSTPAVHLHTPSSPWASSPCTTGSQGLVAVSRTTSTTCPLQHPGGVVFLVVAMATGIRDGMAGS